MAAGTTPRARTIILTDASTVAFDARLADYDGTVGGATPTPTPTPTPAPVFTTQPNLSPTYLISGNPITITPGTVTGGTITSRSAMLGTTALTIVGGQIQTTAGQSGTVTYQETATGVDGQVSLSMIRTATIAAADTGAPPSLMGFQAGYNMDGMNFYIPGGLQTDWGKHAHYDSSSVVFIPPVKGTYEVVVTPTSTTLSNFTSGITVTPIDVAAGRYSIAIADYPTNNKDARGVAYSGTRPTRFAVTKPGYSGRTSQEFLSGFQGKWLRNLDMDAANNLPVVGPDIVRPLPTDDYFPESTTGSIIPYHVQADAVADLKAARPDFVGLWDVLSCDLTDAAITARATYQRDNMPSSVLIALEFGNETFWNVNFSGNVRMMVDGVRKGYYGNATEAEQNAAKVIPYAVGYINTTNFDSPAMSTGEYIAVGNLDGEGTVIFRALRNVSAGTKIIEGADFTKEFGYGDMMTAGRRWHAVRHNQIIEIYRSVFGETRFQSQIVPIIMGQQDSGDYAADMVIQRTFVSGYFAKIKGMGCSFYLNDLGATAKTADALGAAFRANIEPTRAQIAAKASIVASYGKVFMAYEGMTHPNYGDYNSDATYRGAWDALFNSATGQAIMADWAYHVKTTFTGPACGYVGMGHRPWTLRDNWEDGTNKRYVGWNQGLAAGYLPTGYQLKTLVFSNPLQVGTPVSGAILYATDNSAIVCNVPGITIDSAARTYSGTPTGSAGTIANGLVETLAGVTGSPKSSPVTVAAAAAPNGFRHFRLNVIGLVTHPTNEPLSQTSNEYPSLSEWAMTTGGTPVDLSTATSSGDQINAGESTAMMFDGNTATYWTGQQSKTNVIVLDLGPGKAARPDLVTFTDRGDIPQRALGDFMLEASVDGTTWVQIYRTIEAGKTTPGNAFFSFQTYTGAYTNHVFSFAPTYP